PPTMSAPTQKSLPAPRRMTTRASLAATSCVTRYISRHSSTVMALRRSGRLMVIVVSASCRSTRTISASAFIQAHSCRSSPVGLALLGEGLDALAHVGAGQQAAHFGQVEHVLHRMLDAVAVERLDHGLGSGDRGG